MKYTCLRLLSLIGNVAATKPVLSDSTVAIGFERLAQRMGIKEPTLQNGEHQIRLWVKTELMYGEAQQLFILTKRKDKLRLTQYAIRYNKQTFRSHTLITRNVPADINLWQELIKNDVLTLPDQSLLRAQIFPKPIKDSSWVELGSDGALTVHAKKKEPFLIIGDGTSYYFQLFDSVSHRTYGYHCPESYSRVRAKVVELRKVTAILRLIWHAFEVKQEICQHHLSINNLRHLC